MREEEVRYKMERKQRIRREREKGKEGDKLEYKEDMTERN